MGKFRISALLFDIGNTLIDAHKIMNHSLLKSAQMLKEKRIIEDEIFFISAYKNVDESIHGPKINHLFSDVDIIVGTFNNLGIEPTLYQVELFIGFYRDQVRKRIKSNKELIYFFSSLKKAGFKIGIVTDGSTIEQTEQLFKLGIMEYIDTCVTSEDMGVEKPEKSIFLKALSDLEISKRGLSMMVGDDYNRDVLGANSLGIKTALIKKYSINYKIGEIKPDIVINELFHLSKYIVRV